MNPRQQEDAGPRQSRLKGTPTPQGWAPEALPDPRHYRSVIGSFATGVAVVTARHEDQPFGMTMNSITSVSLDPCLLLICPRKESLTGRAILGSGRFAVNILRDDQQAVSKIFMSPSPDRFAEVDWQEHPGGVPLLAGCAAYLVCDLAGAHGAGDHEILLGRVVDCRAEHSPPLVFHRGAYRALA